jgi:hypothetical protein
MNGSPRCTASHPFGFSLADDAVTLGTFSAVAVFNDHPRSASGTSKNGHRSAGTPDLPTNDSVLFSVRFCAVHPKDACDCRRLQFFEVPLPRSVSQEQKG